MARLLRTKDYERLIQSDNLDQVTESNSQTLLDVEQAAQTEMISYLAQRYLTSQIFTDTTVFSITAVYKAKNLIYLNASVYSSTSLYALNALTLQGGKVYYCSTAIVIAEAFTIAHWTLLGNQYDWFYITLPQPEYSSTTTYAVGDKVWYFDKVYTCAIANNNILPTQSAYWGTGVAYSVTAVWPIDATKWSVGDNRNQQVVLFLIDITLYHLHSRINPRNIPDLRKERYDGNGPNQTGGAIGWLKKVASGDVTADLPNISPEQGLSIRYGNANDPLTQSRNFLW